MASDVCERLRHEGCLVPAELTMGADYHAHGLEKNRHAVDTFCRSAFDDGLTKRRVTVDEFFADFIASVRRS